MKNFYNRKSEISIKLLTNQINCGIINKTDSVKNNTSAVPYKCYQHLFGDISQLSKHELRNTITTTDAVLSVFHYNTVSYKCQECFSFISLGERRHS